MRLPNHINKLLQVREQYIDDHHRILKSSIVKYQNDLLTKINQEIILSLERDAAGRILESSANYRLLATLDALYKRFTKENKSRIGDKIKTATAEIARQNNHYFLEIAADEIAIGILNAATQAAKDYTYLSLGLTDKGLVTDGFLDALISNPQLRIELNRFTAQAVTGRMPMKTFIRQMNERVAGTTEKTGGHERAFNTFARDIYSQYNAAYSKTVADKIGLEHFIYTGGLIKDSRDFCVAHNAKVYTSDEAKQWKTWTVNKGMMNSEFPPGYKIKEQPEKWDITPGYIADFPMYSPQLHLGGFNCRHLLGYISRRLAERMRPSLKKDFEETENIT